MSEPIVGQADIHKVIMGLNFRDCHAKIRMVDAQATLGDGVVIQVGVSGREGDWDDGLEGQVVGWNRERGGDREIGEVEWEKMLLEKEIEGDGEWMLEIEGHWGDGR